MPIPKGKEMQTSILLNSVKKFSLTIEELQKNLLSGRKGTVQISVTDYLKFLEEARRVDYIVASLALAPLGVSLLMPESREARMFRSELDSAILQQLQELEEENAKPKIIITDNGVH